MSVSGESDSQSLRSEVQSQIDRMQKQSFRSKAEEEILLHAMLQHQDKSKPTDSSVTNPGTVSSPPREPSQLQVNIVAANCGSDQHYRLHDVNHAGDCLYEALSYSMHKCLNFWQPIKEKLLSVLKCETGMSRTIEDRKVRQLCLREALQLNGYYKRQDAKPLNVVNASLNFDLQHSMSEYWKMFVESAYGSSGSFGDNLVLSAFPAAFPEHRLFVHRRNSTPLEFDSRGSENPTEIHIYFEGLHYQAFIPIIGEANQSPSAASIFDPIQERADFVSEEMNWKGAIPDPIDSDYPELLTNIHSTFRQSMVHYRKIGDIEQHVRYHLRMKERLSRKDTNLVMDQAAAIMHAAMHGSFSTIRDQTSSVMVPDADLILDDDLDQETDSEAEEKVDHSKEFRESESNEESKMNSLHVSMDDVSESSANSSITSVSCTNMQIVGEVQSGKTMSMISVVAKAIDRGFQVIVIMSGNNNVLRAQTQKRIESAFPGRYGLQPQDPKDQRRFVWITDLQRDVPQSFSRTKATNDQDSSFDPSVIRNNIQQLSKDSVIMAVIKKCTPSLRTIHAKLLLQLPSSRRILYIDDESDHCSVNVARPNNACSLKQTGCAGCDQCMSTVPWLFSELVSLVVPAQEEKRRRLEEEAEETERMRLREAEESGQGSKKRATRTIRVPPLLKSEHRSTSPISHQILLVRYTATPQANLLENRGSPLYPSKLWVLERPKNTNSYLGGDFFYTEMPINLFDPYMKHMVYDWSKRAINADTYTSPLQPIPYADFPNYAPVKPRDDQLLSLNKDPNPAPEYEFAVSRDVKNELYPEGIRDKYGQGRLNEIQMQFYEKTRSRVSDGTQLSRENSPELLKHDTRPASHPEPGEEMEEHKSLEVESHDRTLCQGPFSTSFPQLRVLPFSLVQACVDYLLTGGIRRWRAEVQQGFDPIFDQRIIMQQNSLSQLFPFKVHLNLFADFRTLLTSLGSTGSAYPNQSPEFFNELSIQRSQLESESSQLSRNHAFVCANYLSQACVPDLKSPVLWHTATEDWEAKRDAAQRMAEAAKCFLTILVVMKKRNGNDSHAKVKLSKLITYGNADLIVDNKTGTKVEQRFAIVSQFRDCSSIIHEGYLLVNPDSHCQAHSWLLDNIDSIATHDLHVSKNDTAEGLHHAAIVHLIGLQKVQFHVSEVVEDIWFKVARMLPFFLEVDQADSKNQGVLPIDKFMKQNFPYTYQLKVKITAGGELPKALQNSQNKFQEDWAEYEAVYSRWEEEFESARENASQDIRGLFHPDSWSEAVDYRTVLCAFRMQWQRLQNRSKILGMNTNMPCKDDTEFHKWAFHTARHTVVRLANRDKPQLLFERILKEFDYDGDVMKKADITGTKDKFKVPQNLIVVGGNMLSRGLTIKGLTVSYYARSSVTDQADTSMQMNRWFGHKSKDKDLVTVYLQERQANLFLAVNQFDVALRRDLIRFIKEDRNVRTEYVQFLQNCTFASSVYSITSGPKSKNAVVVRPRKSEFITPIMEPRSTAMDNFFATKKFVEHLRKNRDMDEDDLDTADQKFDPNEIELFRNVNCDLVVKLLSNLVSGSSENPAGRLANDLENNVFSYKKEGSELLELSRINVAVLSQRVEPRDVDSEKGYHEFPSKGFQCPIVPDENQNFDPTTDVSLLDARFTRNAETGMDEVHHEDRGWFFFRQMLAVRVPEATEPDPTELSEKAIDADDLKYVDDLTCIRSTHRKPGAPILIVIHKNRITASNAQNTSHPSTTDAEAQTAVSRNSNADAQGTDEGDDDTPMINVEPTSSSIHSLESMSDTTEPVPWYPTLSFFLPHGGVARVINSQLSETDKKNFVLLDGKVVRRAKKNVRTAAVQQFHKTSLAERKKLKEGAKDTWIKHLAVHKTLRKRSEHIETSSLLDWVAKIAKIETYPQEFTARLTSFRKHKRILFRRDLDAKSLVASHTKPLPDGLVEELLIFIDEQCELEGMFFSIDTGEVNMRQVNPLLELPIPSDGTERTWLSQEQLQKAHTYVCDIRQLASYPASLVMIGKWLQSGEYTYLGDVEDDLLVIFWNWSQLANQDFLYNDVAKLDREKKSLVSALNVYKREVGKCITQLAHKYHVRLKNGTAANTTPSPVRLQRKRKQPTTPSRSIDLTMDEDNQSGKTSDDEHTAKRKNFGCDDA